ncbi:MAG TPA: hypothetical protein VFI91_02805 [Longimicrobiaceae bacterium]|nr:hypothetical protein [Longimicrobiaceae bacterium]
MTIYPDEIPMEYREDPVMYGASHNGSFGSYTYVKSVSFSFNANHAVQTLELIGRSVTDQVSTPVARSEFSHLVPNWPGSLTTTNQLTLQRNCGYTVDAYETRKVWNSFAMNLGGFFEWGHQQASVQYSDDQADCPSEIVEEPADGGGGGGGGGGGEDDGEPVDDISNCLVEYWYDIDTGEIIDWRVLYCY